MFKCIKINLTHKILPILGLLLFVSFIFIFNSVEANVDFICNNKKYSLPDFPSSYDGVDLSSYKFVVFSGTNDASFTLWACKGGMWFFPYDGDNDFDNNRTVWVLGGGFHFTYNPSKNNSWVYSQELNDTKYYLSSKCTFFEAIRYSNFDIKNRSDSVVFEDNSNSILPLNPYIADTDSTISNMTSDYLLIFPR